ncbi:hypothetical protein EJ03DRAFT_44693 [Teratosphaeria nubilosa]|uniref:Uncharacterized protein n=1 Tax=Teratosphaeria nubilosa TaxID=161662 RepID=A0A6G1LF54_9PEZI|nr:hypothetical protein EJ03DRAFT_44693 [Teratosphaeria nubilosa]
MSSLASPKASAAVIAAGFGILFRGQTCAVSLMLKRQVLVLMAQDGERRKSQGGKAKARKDRLRCITVL